MGKWCEVKCCCPDRVSVGWSVNGDVYQCGHPNGTLVQFWPGYIFEIGQMLKEALEHEPGVAQDFELLFRISDTHNYFGEYLSLSRAEADLWRLEIEELQAIQRGKNRFSGYALYRWKRLWRDFFEDPWHREDAVSVDKILADCLRLCDASSKSGNPIEFML